MIFRYCLFEEIFNHVVSISYKKNINYHKTSKNGFKYVEKYLASCFNTCRIFLSISSVIYYYYYCYSYYILVFLGLASPGPSATDRFQSPINQVTRQLFPSIQAGQSLLQRHTHISM